MPESVTEADINHDGFTGAIAGDPRFVPDVLAAASDVEELSEAERECRLGAGRDGTANPPCRRRDGPSSVSYVTSMSAGGYYRW